MQVEAGQFCTFAVSGDGVLVACGKGSYGRLGLGDSNNQTQPKKLVFENDHPIKRVSSSKGSDGHTLALTTEGEIYSWGDGELSLVFGEIKGFYPRGPRRFFGKHDAFTQVKSFHNANAPRRKIFRKDFFSSGQKLQLL